MKLRRNTGAGKEVAVDRSAADVAALLAAARTVVVVPGYGLAAARAQHVLRDLADALEVRGTEVRYAVHPVAGRMPGHLNVLLDGAGVPFAALRDLDAANAELPAADVALLVGANDVVNPAARTDPASPLHGMPILDVTAAGAVVALKRGHGRGYAGVDNALLHDPGTTLLRGDAKYSLARILAALDNHRN